MYDVIPVVSERNTDCGATCLKMLLDFYGVDVPLETLINECNTRLIGCSAKDVSRVGKAHGLDMQVFQMDAEELVKQDRPAIVWWMYCHFCVFCGVDDDGKVVICNPDKGRYRVSQGTFKSFYTGIALFNGEPADLPAPKKGGKTSGK